MAETHDIYATPADRPRWYNKAVLHAKQAYGLHSRWSVQDDGEADDLAGLIEAQHPRRTGVSSLCPGECALALDIVEMAIKASCAKWDSADRRGARAWLLNATPIYPARLCFESLGIDYDAARDVLVKRWKEQG